MAGEVQASREPFGKDIPMLETSQTTMTVHDMRFRENAAKAERYHALVRGDKSAGKTLVVIPVIRMPRISLISRLFHARLRPA